MRGNLIPQRCGFYQKRIKKKPRFQALSCESDCMPGRVYSASSQTCCSCFHVCGRVHVGVPASARGMQNPEGNARFPQSLPVSCTEAGSVAEPEARRVK